MGRRIIVTHEDWFKLPDKQLERKIELSHKIKESTPKKKSKRTCNRMYTNGILCT